MKKILSLPLSNYFNIRYTPLYEMNKSKSVCELCDDAFVKNICFAFARNETEKVESKTKAKHIFIIKYYYNIKYYSKLYNDNNNHNCHCYCN